MVLHEPLSEREERILTAIVEDHIRTAQPVASSRVQTLSGVGVSPATIRQVMANLEVLGHLSHPHTSAGKIPTDKGYRTYVDELMTVDKLEAAILNSIQRQLEELSGEIDSFLQLVSHIIAGLTGSIGVAVAPVSGTAHLMGLRLIRADEGRLLMILETDSRELRAVAVQIDRRATEEQLRMVEEILVERLCGLSLEEIQATVGARLEGTLVDDLGLGGFILEHADNIFEEPEAGLLHSHGLEQILQIPDVFNRSSVTTLASLMEDEDRLRNLVVPRYPGNEPDVTIGTEHQDADLEMLATIRRGYYVGYNIGTIAVLAPKRVNYRHVCAILDFLSVTMTNILGYES